MTITVLTSFRPEHAEDVLAATRWWPQVRRSTAPDEELYRSWYAAPGTVEDWDPWWPPLGRLLRAAHAGGRRWSEPVPVLTTGLAGVVLTRDAGGARAHGRGDHVVADDGPRGREPRVGERVRVLRRGGAHQAEGWWRSWGDGWSHATRQPYRRLYLAPRTSTVVDLVAGLTAVLIDLGRPWLLKCVAEPALLGRADAVVVYLPDADLPAAGRRVVAEVAALTRPVRVPFTAPLAPGISWAEDPGDGMSFGETVCRLLAGAFTAWESEGRGPVGEAEPPRLLETVADHLDRHGLDPAAPHRRPAPSAVR